MNVRNQFKGVNSIKFHNTFSSDDDCYQYLAEVKCRDTGYQCRKCGHTKYYKGVKPFSRRCMKCKYDESSTARTMFDKCKFPLQLAFYIAFKISTKKKGMSSLELSQEFELRQKTYWEFKWKIQQTMQSSKLHPISSIVYVDEFYIGGEEEGKRGRSKGEKKLVVVALEIVEGGVRRASAQCINNAAVADFGNILGGLFTQFIIKKGIEIPKARKISVGIFGSMMALSLILESFIINGPIGALIVLAVAGFGYATYTTNTMAFPADVVPNKRYLLQCGGLLVSEQV